MKRPPEPEFVAFIGIDWADAKHDVCLQPANTSEREFSVIVHRPEAIEAWAQELKLRFHGGSIAVCLELTKGPLVSALLKYDFLVLFPVNRVLTVRVRNSWPARSKRPVQPAVVLRVSSVDAAQDGGGARERRLASVAS